MVVTAIKITECNGVISSTVKRDDHIPKRSYSRLLRTNIKLDKCPKCNSQKTWEVEEGSAGDSACGGGNSSSSNNNTELYKIKVCSDCKLIAIQTWKLSEVETIDRQEEKIRKIPVTDMKYPTV